MARAAFAPAKVNLFLHVGAPGADGYHPLSSLMVFANVGDQVGLQPDGAPAFSVHGPFARDLAGEGDNLVLRAARALREATGAAIPPLMLDKVLPVASGLGGGSSDAGAALRLLRAARGLDVSDAQLEAIAASLGADGAACLWGRPVVAEGRGERLSPAPGLPPLDVVLVRPPAPVSTAAVYRKFDALGVFSDVTLPVMPDAFESAEEVAGWLALMRNDLEAAAIAVEPAVGSVLMTLEDESETLLARVSGSGGTCFALCEGDVEAETLAERIEMLEPRWWVQRCRLGGPWPDPE